MTFFVKPNMACCFAFKCKIHISNTCIPFKQFSNSSQLIIRQPFLLLCSAIGLNWRRFKY